MQRLRIKPYLPEPRNLAALAGLFVFITICSWGCVVIDSGDGGNASVWWSNSILFSVLLLNNRKLWPSIFVTAYVANVTAHTLSGGSILGGFGLSLCDMLEAAIAVYPFARDQSGAISFSRPRELAKLYVMGAVAGPFISAVCATAWARQFDFGLNRMFMLQWFASNALAAVGLTPILLALFKRETYAIFRREQLAESISLLALVALCAALVFYQTSYPLIFLLFPPLLLLVVRLGLGGGMLGVCMIACVSAFAAVHDRGPLTVVEGITWQRQLFMNQVVIASSVLCVALVGVVLNERRALEEAARRSEHLHRLLTENSRDIIVLMDLNYRREYVSPAVQWTMGWDPKDLLGITYKESIVHPEDVVAMTESLEALKAGEPAKTITYRCRKKDGSYLWMEAHISLYCDRATGEPIGYVSVVRDVSERKAAEEKLQDAYTALEALAAVDGLTGVSNRRHFDEIFEKEWRRSTRTRQPISLLLLDVDHFKLYNDFYGHVRGDSCLRQIADAVLTVIQRTGDTVARFGGEEFGIILPNTSKEHAFELAEMIRQATADRRLQHDSSSHGIVTVSIGCATMTANHHANLSVLVEAADQALYEAKRAGRNRVIAYEQLSAQPLS